MNRTTAILITLFFGEFGVHRFLAGKIWTGILWLCTMGLFGIGWIYDLILVIGGNFKRKDGTPWGR